MASRENLLLGKFLFWSHLTVIEWWDGKRSSGGAKVLHLSWFLTVWRGFHHFLSILRHGMSFWLHLSLPSVCLDWLGFKRVVRGLICLQTSMLTRLILIFILGLPIFLHLFYKDGWKTVSRRSMAFHRTLWYSEIIAEVSELSAFARQTFPVVFLHLFR